VTTDEDVEYTETEELSVVTGVGVSGSFADGEEEVELTETEETSVVTGVEAFGSFADGEEEELIDVMNDDLPDSGWAVTNVPVPDGVVMFVADGEEAG